MSLAQAVNVLNGVGWQPAPVIMDEDPLRHIGVPMRARAVEILIDFRDEFGFFYRVWGIALEDGLGADAPAVALQITVGAVRTHFLEIGAESMAGEPNEPVLERGAALGVERQPESIDINGMLKLIHGAV